MGTRRPETTGRLALPPRPRAEKRCTTYRLHLADGSEAGEATYAVMIRPGEEIVAGSDQRFRVLDVVPIGEEDESPFVGLLQVEAA